MTIRLITFDLDDTLWKTGPIIQRAEQEMLRWISVREPDFLVTYNSQGSTLLKSIVAERPEIAHDVTSLRIAALERSFLAIGKTPALANSMAHHAFDVFQEWRNKVELFDGALDVLQILRKRYRIVSLTNGNAEVSRTPLAGLFEKNLNAASVGAKKPNHRMFVAALEAVEVSANEAVHVGDHPEDDVTGAINAGMYAVQVDLGIRATSPLATAVVTELRQLPKVIDAINA